MNIGIVLYTAINAVLPIILLIILGYILKEKKFLNENFANVKCSYVKLERDFLERSYEVMLADGTKIEFTGKGLWEEVDSRYGEVPEVIIPEPIRHYINENYSGSKVLRIERNRYGFEVKLSNKLELTFSKEFQLIDIDD